MAIGEDTVEGSGNPLENFVNTTINNNDIVIFSKSNCAPCQITKSLFEKIKKPYTVVDLDTREDAFELQTILGSLTGETTVPRVFIKGKSVGGASEVNKLFMTGKLQAMLK